MSEQLTDAQERIAYKSPEQLREMGYDVNVDPHEIVKATELLLRAYNRLRRELGVELLRLERRIEQIEKTQEGHYGEAP